MERIVLVTDEEMRDAARWLWKELGIAAELSGAAALAALLTGKLELPKGAKVASVDKFQGKEAPVCILSLGCGGQDSGPRGLSFVLNRNRMNVAISRAQALFVLVASPSLTALAASQKEILLANQFCRLVAN